MRRSWRAVALPFVRAPEIDSTSAVSAITLLIGGLAMLSARKRARIF